MKSIFFLFCICILICPFYLNSQIIITEINSHQTSGASYMEIYNRGSVAQNLSGWDLRYYNNGSTIPTATESLSGILNPGSYMVLARSSTDFQTEYGFAPDFSHGWFYFNDENDGVEIYNGTSVVDRFNNTGGSLSSWPDNHCFERINYPNSGTDISNHWSDIGINQTGTPRAPNDSPLPVQSIEIHASIHKDQVILYWTTTGELDIIGFHLLRAADRNGPYHRITMDIIKSKGNHSGKYNYQYFDTNIKPPVDYWYKVEVIDINYAVEEFGPVRIADDEKAIFQNKIHLVQVYPNPMNPSTIIQYAVTSEMEHSHINLSIYNSLGQRIITLVDERLRQGQYQIRWNGRDFSGRNVPSGIYYCQMISNRILMDMMKIIKLK